MLTIRFIFLETLVTREIIQIAAEHDLLFKEYKLKKGTREKK